MATGKVLQFDSSRGYGFVAADDGGEDVFLHASVFDGDSSELVPGAPLEFQIMAGDRGRKAFAVHFAERESAPLQKPVIPAQKFGGTEQAFGGTEQAFGGTEQAFAATEDEQMCDVLSQSEFGAELTELLLNTIPALTGAQILEVRQGILEFVKKHGWVDA